MIVYCVLIVTMLLAALSIRLVWVATRSPFTYTWHRLLLSIVLGISIYLYGPWAFVSVCLRYAYAVCFVLAVLIGLRRGINKREEPSPAGVVVNLIVSALCLVLSVLYFTGTTGKPYGIAHLSLPFKSGKYLVFQGGKGWPTNLFHYKFRGAVYAMDIVKLNSWGNRARRIFSTHLEDYAIFGDTIYSPCNGVVIGTRSDRKDAIPPHLVGGPGNLNMVLIETDSSYVFLGHLRQGCVFVNAGDTVHTGQPLGCAGNSGFSLEPHLHIQVHAKTDTTIPWYKETPLQIAFDGKTYNLFEVMNAGKE